MGIDNLYMVGKKFENISRSGPVQSGNSYAQSGRALLAGCMACLNIANLRKFVFSDKTYSRSVGLKALSFLFLNRFF